MTSGSAGMHVRVARSFVDVDAAAWDALVADAHNPFVEHAFLLALEHSGSIGPKTAWAPRILLVEDGGALLGAAPAFLRSDSFGEFIFDWQIADAARRLGLAYYPKVTVAVPFTPATGPRLLGAPQAQAPLAAALWNLVEREGASSLHVLFCEEHEQRVLGAVDAPSRASLQFHWHNAGYGNFDDFLSALDHSARKQIKRERRRVAEAGLVVDVRDGAAVPRAWWPRLYQLYAGIYDRKWGKPYLTERFFQLIPERLAARAVVAIARDPKKSAGPDDVDGIVAMTLSFERGPHCYGRYWGSDVDVPGLHFELCYYAILERAIRKGQTLVEAGAQGEHKLKRGYLPSLTRSAHRFVDPRLHAAASRYFVDEAAAVGAERDALMEHSPFRSGP